MSSCMGAVVHSIRSRGNNLLQFISSIDDMYDFFMHWSPQIPGTDGEVGLAERGFIAVEASPGGIVQNDDSSGTGAAATTGCVRQSSKRWQVIHFIRHSR
jgi:hypothetical protein